MTPTREISAALQMYASKATEIEIKIALAHRCGFEFEERLEVRVDDEAVEVEEIADDHGARFHRLLVPDDKHISVTYDATVTGRADPIPVEASDRSRYLRPSRYAESDKFFGFVAGQFDLSRPEIDILSDVTAFVTSRLIYKPGSSDPIDGAADTLLAGAGVCRDYAHLTVALLRAVNIPARLVAVYAPGCDPMDFHAVVEALIDGRWLVVDPTGLAPRQPLMRIATGRDAADTAFLDNHRGSLHLRSYLVMATIEGELPDDDGTAPVQIS